MTATVLVVEDERTLRQLIRTYLERAGFSALSTESGAEAITLAAAVSPDLVVLDLSLPDMSGEEVLISGVRGHEFAGYERTVDSHIRNLRRKIEKDPARPGIVQTVPSGGYRLGLARDG